MSARPAPPENTEGCSTLGRSFRSGGKNVCISARYLSVVVPKNAARSSSTNCERSCEVGERAISESSFSKRRVLPQASQGWGSLALCYCSRAGTETGPDTRTAHSSLEPAQQAQYEVGEVSLNDLNWVVFLFELGWHEGWGVCSIFGYTNMCAVSRLGLTKKGGYAGALL